MFFLSFRGWNPIFWPTNFILTISPHKWDFCRYYRKYMFSLWNFWNYYSCTPPSPPVKKRTIFGALYMIYVHKVRNVVCNAPIGMKIFTTFLGAWDAFSTNKFAFSINNFFSRFTRGKELLNFRIMKFNICSYLMIKGS